MRLRFRPSSQRSAERKGMAALLARLRDDQGAIMIEMAIGYIVMLTMLFVVLECTMMGYTYSVMAEAAKEGVRYACVHGVDSSTCSGPSTGCDISAANVILTVKDYAKSLNASSSTMNVTVNYPDGLSTGTSRVQVAIAFTYKPLFSLPGASHAFSVSSTGRIMY